MSADLHRRPFDEGTLVKLRLFQAYLAEWLPVFTAKESPNPNVTVVDFFAGPGRDREGIKGSPLIALEEIRKWNNQIRDTRHPVRLILNEKARGKYEALCASLKGEDIPSDLCLCTAYNLRFEAAFNKVYQSLMAGPNLLFLDQQGVKFITDDIFSRILALPRTDFIFFIASSSLRRFAAHPSFRKHLKIPQGEISARCFNDTHRFVVDYYGSFIPKNKEFYLGRFSIKKGSNLYGLVFGSGHPLGIEKFLRVCWKEDPARGEANFDIDDEGIVPSTPHLFADMDKPQKLRVFEKDLRERIISQEVATDRQVYVVSLREGFLPGHGRGVLTELQREGLVNVERGLKPRVSKEGYKEPRQLMVKKA